MVQEQHCFCSRSVHKTSSTFHMNSFDVSAAEALVVLSAVMCFCDNQLVLFPPQKLLQVDKITETLLWNSILSDLTMVSDVL